MEGFSSGDKVKIVKNESGSRNKAGDIGIIHKIGPHDCKVFVEKRGEGGNWHKYSDLILYNETQTYEIY